MQKIFITIVIILLLVGAGVVLLQKEEPKIVEDFVEYESTRLRVSFFYPPEAEVLYEAGMAKIIYTQKNEEHTEITSGFTFFIDIKNEEDPWEVAERRYEEASDPISSPEEVVFGSREAIRFHKRDGLGAEQVMHIFKEEGRVVTTMHFIAGDYGDVVERIFESITLKEIVLRDIEPEFVARDEREAQEIRAVDADGEEFFRLTIEELREWMGENWDIFEETPQVGGRDVEPRNFGFFDRAASVSPQDDKMIFSVHDYAVATTTTFIIVADLYTGELSVIDEPVRGSVEDYVWSSDGDLVAYTLGTARARGDLLSVDDVSERRKRFLLQEEDIIQEIDTEQTSFPVFRDPEWEGRTLYFTTDHPEEEEVRWRIDENGEDLEMVEE